MFITFEWLRLKLWFLPFWYMALSLDEWFADVLLKCIFA